MTQLHALVVYVPETHIEEVLLAIGDAGAGRIGNYSHCAFTSPGTGRFTPLPGAQPSVGEVHDPTTRRRVLSTALRADSNPNPSSGKLVDGPSCGVILLNSPRTGR